VYSFTFIKTTAYGILQIFVSQLQSSNRLTASARNFRIVYLQQNRCFVRMIDVHFLKKHEEGQNMEFVIFYL